VQRLTCGPLFLYLQYLILLTPGGKIKRTPTSPNFYKSTKNGLSVMKVRVEEDLASFKCYASTSPVAGINAKERRAVSEAACSLPFWRAHVHNSGAHWSFALKTRRVTASSHWPGAVPFALGKTYPLSLHTSCSGLQ